MLDSIVFLFVGEEEYPTLLHFAARYGLKSLTWELLECLGSIQALHVQNCDGWTALQLAEMNGHEAVVNCLNSFIEAVVSLPLYTSFLFLGSNHMMMIQIGSR